MLSWNWTFYLLFMIVTERERGRDIGRGRSRLHAPGARHGTRSRVSGSRPGPKAGAKLLRHPGIPVFNLFIHERHRLRERGRDTGRGRSRLLAGSPMQDLILDPGITTEGRRPTAEPPKHPKDNIFLSFFLSNFETTWLRGKKGTTKLLISMYEFSCLNQQMTKSKKIKEQ